MQFKFSAFASILALPVAVRGVPSDLTAREPQTCCDKELAVPLLRSYNPAITDHFYTTNAAEHQNAVLNLGYQNEGTTGRIFPVQELHTVALFRLYNGALGDHFYTTSAPERDNAANNLGYSYEGIAGYVYPDAWCGAEPLFRAYKGAAGAWDHFYTMSAPEMDNAVNNLGYSREGITGYIFPA